jgi:hypothetical protein
VFSTGTSVATAEGVSVASGTVVLPEQALSSNAATATKANTLLNFFIYQHPFLTDFSKIFQIAEAHIVSIIIHICNSILCKL